jgi:hypothetical protein
MAYINPPNTVIAGTGLSQVPIPGPGSSGATQVVLSMTNPGAGAGYYGIFYDTTTQLNTAINTALPMSINTTVDSFGVNLVDGSKITVDNYGIYNVQFSAQFSKTTGTDHDVDIWFQLNGSPMLYSNTKITLFGSNSKSVPAWNFMTPLDVGDELQIMWSSSFATMEILSQGPQSNPDRPAIPSIILTVQLVKEL